MTTTLPLVAAANRSLAKLKGVTLDPARVEAYAAKKEGVARVPGEHWRGAFEALCADLGGEAALHPLGRVIANGQLVGLLRARCRAERLFARHPDIAEQPIERPIIIMGQMRSGSTRTQRLLARDPALRATRLFETLFPVPRARGRQLGRVAAAAAVHATLRKLNPAVQQIHPTGALQPEEEFGFLSHAFHSGQFAVQWNVPRLMAEEEARDLTTAARELKQLLQLNIWASGGNDGRRQVLKCPAYSGMADALLAVFPDAQLICLQRDPVTVVASSASLVVEQRRIHSDEVDKAEVGREWLERTAKRERLLGDARKRHPETPAIDLSYEAVNEDWRATMREVYRFLDRPFGDDIAIAMERYLSSAREHVGHRYALADYHLSSHEVRAAFA